MSGIQRRSAMSEFVLLYRNTLEARRESHGSPEKAQQTMKKWRAWFDDMTRKGCLKNIGQPLDDTGDVVGGYSLIEARNLEEAAQIASACPIIEIGGSVEVRPVMKIDV